MNCFVSSYLSWTNWVNSGKFMDNCWILCQVMADKENFYNDLIIINLYQKYQKTFVLVGTEGVFFQCKLFQNFNCTPSPYSGNRSKWAFARVKSRIIRYLSHANFSALNPHEANIYGTFWNSATLHEWKPHQWNPQEPRTQCTV